MSENKSVDQEKEVKKNTFLRLLFANLFGGKKELSILEEEDVQSPWRTVLSTFKGNKISMTGLIVFITIFLIVLIGPLIRPVDLGFSDTLQKDVAPGFDMMKFPEELDGKVEDLSVGSTFTIAASTDGKPYVWGKTRITAMTNIRNFPVDEKTKKKVDMGKIVRVAAGFDHVMALNSNGELFAWGNDRQKQSIIPSEVSRLTNIKDIYAGYQCSLVLTEDGHLYFFGNSRNTDYDQFHQYQGHLDDVALTSDGIIGLTFDGEVVYLGTEQNSYAKVPGNMGRVKDIASTSSNFAALNEDGQVYIWGNVSSKTRENIIPETDSKIVSLKGGRYHYTALTEDNKIVSWGADYYRQATIPDKLKDEKIERIYTGYYQNYVVNEKGKIFTWGLKGYLFGTDDLGRDIFTRLLNGGRMSMTIGAVAVVISTIIGVIVGSLSGYFGGRLDNILQRLSEIVDSLPFLPFAMILSALIGNSMTTNQKTVLIMVILGLLSWTGLQRLIRAQVLSVREQEYVVAAKALGIKESGIIFKHILPNVISVIIVSATLSFATSMLTEASLSYLGFGVQPPQPTWGNMLFGANNSQVIQNYWWRWVFASALLGICVICINLVGDGLRDAIDPKSQER
ncbi:MAG: ABC transporter permease subunit [Tissierellaceae bacterium]